MNADYTFRFWPVTVTSLMFDNVVAGQVVKRCEEGFSIYKYTRSQPESAGNSPKIAS